MTPETSEATPSLSSIIDAGAALAPPVPVELGAPEPTSEATSAPVEAQASAPPDALDLSALRDPARREQYLAERYPGYQPVQPQAQVPQQPVYQPPASVQQAAPVPAFNVAELDPLNPADMARLIEHKLTEALKPALSHIEQVQQAEQQMQHAQLSAHVENIAKEAAEKVLPGVSSWLPPAGRDTRTIEQQVLGNTFLGKFQETMSQVHPSLWTNPQAVQDVMQIVAADLSPLAQKLGLSGAPTSQAPAPRLAYSEPSGATPAKSSAGMFSELLAKGDSAGALSNLLARAS